MEGSDGAVARTHIPDKDSTNTAATIGIYQAQPRCSCQPSQPCGQQQGSVHVSRLHCALIRCDDGALLVVDRDSRNGTFIDGVRCERAFLHDGAVLRVGRTELVAFTERSRDAMSASEARAALGQFFGHSRASQRSMARMLGVATSVVRALRQDLRVQRRPKR